MTKLRLKNFWIGDEDWTDLINRPFPAPKEFSVAAPIPNSGIFANLFFGHPHRKTLKICVEFPNLQAADLFPIRSLQELLEICLDFSGFNEENFILDSNLVSSTFNPKLKHAKMKMSIILLFFRFFRSNKKYTTLYKLFQQKLRLYCSSFLNFFLI
jgi:hypothetical protein